MESYRLLAYPQMILIKRIIPPTVIATPEAVHGCPLAADGQISTTQSTGTGHGESLQMLSGMRDIPQLVPSPITQVLWDT